MRVLEANPSALTSIISLLLLILPTALVQRQTPRKQGTLNPLLTPSSPLSIRVVGNRLVNGQGQTIRLLGVNRSGTQYACADNWGIFSGPSDAASVKAMASWRINTVRIPLNEHCWLGINGVNPTYSGTRYQDAITNYVNLLHQHGLYAILELHYSAPGRNLAKSQQIMADLDHSPAFWSSVAAKFKNYPAVLFDLYNEPHNAGNNYSCWRDGCTISTVQTSPTTRIYESWQSAGMQSLVNAVRSTGATQPIILSGEGWAGDLYGWMQYKPDDTARQLVASVHIYNFSVCKTVTCWNNMIKPVATVVPVVSGELGQNGCTHEFIDTYMNWLDSIGAGYLGWGWVRSSCSMEPALIMDYSGTPTNYGIGLRNHLLYLR